MLSFENAFRAQGKQCIAGLDEVGRGPLAGPVVACAVVLPDNFDIFGIDDSKKLTEKHRRVLFDKLTAYPDIKIGLGIVSERVIDKCNILRSTKIAMKESITGLGVVPDHLLIDGLVLDNVNISQSCIIKGDSLSLSIASASIIAKVFRDFMMSEYDIHLIGYGFSKHKGYGTKDHIMAVNKNGACCIHRKTFAPLNRLS